MRIFSPRFISIVGLALALMIVIFIAQLFTNRATLALTKGNLQAVETFRINNRMQELVNIAFDLQTKLRNSAIVLNEERSKAIADSLNYLGYNSNALTQTNTQAKTKTYLHNLNGYIDRQIMLSFRILDFAKRKDESGQRMLADSLRILQLGDSIYTNCLQVQKQLEIDLENTLVLNTKQANKLSYYNRLLALAAIIAIVLMATIIIRRHRKQLQLINDLEKAQKVAERSTEAKDQFLANMSHELRTPLNALLGFGQLLSQTKLDEQQTQYAEVITSSSNNLLNIVNDVLDISKIEAGKLRIDNRVFELSKLMQDIEMMFSASIREKGLFYHC
ncbi:MAG: hybrid sensor histidine kinase/response regulator, partial [Pedobacter sp.]